jgi:hypothetical protein
MSQYKDNFEFVETVLPLGGMVFIFILILMTMGLKYVESQDIKHMDYDVVVLRVTELGGDKKVVRHKIPSDASLQINFNKSYGYALIINRGCGGCALNMNIIEPNTVDFEVMQREKLK